MNRKYNEYGFKQYNEEGVLEISMKSDYIDSELDFKVNTAKVLTEGIDIKHACREDGFLFEEKIKELIYSAVDALGFEGWYYEDPDFDLKLDGEDYIATEEDRKLLLKKFLNL